MEGRLFAMAILLRCLSTGVEGAALIAEVRGTSSALFPRYVLSNISIGTPLQQQKHLLLSLEATSVPWLVCGSASFNPYHSSTFSPCLKGSVCSQPLSSPLKGHLIGRLATDNFSVHKTRASGRFEPQILAVHNITFACVSKLTGVDFLGLLSLSGAYHALPSQLATKASVSKKFAYCLPRSPSPTTRAPIFFGDGVNYMFGPSPLQINLSDFLSNAHVALFEDKSGKFSMKVLGVTLNGATINVTNKPFKLEISSVQPYTKLSRNLYVSLRNNFLAQASALGIVRVSSLSPFDTCFNASTLGFSRVGPHVPTIEFQMVGFARTNFTWQVFGFHSIVQVSSTISCWAFLDAGPHQTSMLGTFQQQNTLIEFDLDNKKLSSTGLLDFFRTSCTDYSF